MATGETGRDDVTVLVVDDEDSFVSMYADWLANRWTVRTATGGEAALDALDEAVDVLLLDRRMPGLSGDEVLDLIRDLGYDCRVAMVTAVPPDFDLLEMGFDDYATKPLDRAELVSMVERLAARSEYSTLVQRYFSTVRKRELLRSEKGEAELAGRTDYRALEERIDELRRRTRQMTVCFGEDDFRALFYDLGS
jgi:DNA-binding response OmpR family regulator